MGHRPQVGAVSVESLCRLFVFFHLCHNSSSRYVIVVVTSEPRVERGDSKIGVTKAPQGP